MVTPCIDILHQLMTRVNEELGTHQGLKHTIPNLDHDIRELMRSLHEHNVYVIEPGWTIDSEKPMVPNIVNVGINLMGGPLNKFNSLMSQLRTRARSAPIVGECYSGSGADGSIHALPVALENEVGDDAWDMDAEHPAVDLDPYFRALDENGGFPKALLALETAEDPELDEYETSCSRSVDYLNTFFFPAYAATASVIIASLHGLLARMRISKSQDTSSAGVLRADDLAENNASTVGRQSGMAILAFNIARALACFALLSMSLYSVIVRKPVETYGIGVSTIWPYIGLCGTFMYTFILALMTMLAKPATTVIASRHLNAVLLTAWVVYMYRDVWPLVTFTLIPMDAVEGRILWAKVVTLTFGAVIVPLLVPRRYVPVNPKGAPTEPSPEQTASLLSVILYSWLDKTIVDAYRLPHLPVDKFPPLADSDQSQYLSAQTSKELDPFQMTNKRRHIGWGLIKVFYWEIFTMICAITANTFTHFLSPLGIRNLLLFMETGGEGAIVRPWIWALSLFLGPFLRASTLSMYMLPWTTVLTRTEAILTHLVFNHALRMRIKAEISETSINEVSVKGKQKSNDTSSVGSGSNNRREQKNVTGKINNLITSDLGSLENARDLLLILLEVPLQIILSIYFLYVVLGWSAFAGLATIVILFPIPGKVASYIKSAQKEKMKQTDARVQNVTECMHF
ncbi:uncharacterized protein FIBRA_01498 [Fibroporia radiculosa]|uniref:ABC transmembrane type-1 domain-containing protein n=1 Tax=Fibroporia radiculosa TaxID=599839 RepID=J4GKE7_9APHY|nr:uncharacterized protein FIBRA_01498 [Fibroporia radiculosa]CCL99480.1 predicted protein [Fibroporia radiculosa]